VVSLLFHVRLLSFVSAFLRNGSRPANFEQSGRPVGQAIVVRLHNLQCPGHAEGEGVQRATGAGNSSDCTASSNPRALNRPPLARLSKSRRSKRGTKRRLRCSRSFSSVPLRIHCLLSGPRSRNLWSDVSPSANGYELFDFSILSSLVSSVAGG
jgi:hypothetical protein